LLQAWVGKLPTFKIGTGFDDATRHLLWAQRDELFGRIVKFKSMLHGTLDAPRHPVFLGFRAEDYS
jgi:DNA ligase-1